MKESKNLRHGFTTGSCAAAAAKAALIMLLGSTEKNEISIITPKGIEFKAKIENISKGENFVKCSVKKDGGDDPDITTGADIYAEVSLMNEVSGDIIIDGGFGVGRVTMPGLDQPVGNAAINHVPREMIEENIREVCSIYDWNGGVKVLVSVPDGEKLAKKTFNPRLGIVGGISILGTSGIVEPMSEQALLDTIKVELHQHRAKGLEAAAVSPGNYGIEFMRDTYGYDLDKSVKCSNFIGDTIDMAVEEGFKTILITGHIGKLIKCSGGIMDTHSKKGDCRMELMAAAALRAGCDSATALEILESVTTEEGLRILKEKNICRETMDKVMDKIMFYLKKKADEKIQVECMIYSTVYGLLASSENAEKVVKELVEKWSTL
ncbi:cobalt-precorrin 5B C1-methyltransferase [Lachnospiraceae bacterium KH1T2]|nr:cobalt-precorrin 5B C1-methyltransferase [Lachnospiraceae bacterium KH1T2]